MSHPFLCFVHIEKAGGITLHNLFHRLYRGYVSPHPDKRFGNPWTAKHVQVLQEMLPFKITGIGGHRMRAFLDYESVIGERVFYFTMMRNPVDRYLSHLNWQKNLMNMGWTIESFTSTPYNDNWQAFRIAGERNLDKAKEIMARNFGLIGMIEKYDESMVLLKAAMGDPSADFRYQEANIKNYGDQVIRFDQLSQEMQEKVIANNAIDIELYRFLKDELYPQYVRRFSADLDTEVDAYRKANRHYQYPAWALIKRKVSNVYLSKLIQPKMLRIMSEQPAENA
jgi:hypothetical protein